MINRFKNKWLKDYYLNGISSKKIPADIEDRLFRKLQLIDDSTCENDLRIPPSNHYEKLKGNLKGLHSIRVSKQWRLIFEWDNTINCANNIYLDPHKY